MKTTTNVDFGIGETLYNMISDDCRSNLYSVGLDAAKAIGREIIIDFDDDPDDRDMYGISIFINDIEAYGYNFKTIEECIAFFNGISAINDVAEYEKELG